MSSDIERKTSEIEEDFELTNEQAERILEMVFEEIEGHIIRIEGRLDGDGVLGVCDCGWTSGEKTTALVKVGIAAGIHASETGHKLRRHN